MARERRQLVYQLIGLKIRETRRKLGISQDELAKKSSLERPSIVLIESGRQRLPIDRLCIIALALNIEPKDLLPTNSELYPDKISKEDENINVIVPEIDKHDKQSIENIRQFVQTYKKG